MKKSIKYLEPIMVLAFVVGLPALGLKWFINVDRKYTAAYSHLYDDLKLKSKDHLNLIEYFEGCLQQRPRKSNRVVSAPICVEKARGWAEKLKMKGNVEEVLNDINLAEAKAYLASKS